APRVLDLDDVRAVVGEKGREHAARDEARAVDDPEPSQRAAHDGAFLRCRVRASMTRASASFSVRPVTVTPYATAVATHSRASFWWTSTSTFTRRKLTAERDRRRTSRAPRARGARRGVSRGGKWTIYPFFRHPAPGL